MSELKSIGKPLLGQSGLVIVDDRSGEDRVSAVSSPASDGEGKRMDSSDHASKPCDTPQAPLDDDSFLRGSLTLSDGDFPLHDEKVEKAEDYGVSGSFPPSSYQTPNRGGNEDGRTQHLFESSSFQLVGDSNLVDEDGSLYDGFKEKLETPLKVLSRRYRDERSLNFHRDSAEIRALQGYKILKGFYNDPENFLPESTDIFLEAMRELFKKIKSTSKDFSGEFKDGVIARLTIALDREVISRDQFAELRELYAPANASSPQTKAKIVREELNRTEVTKAWIYGSIFFCCLLSVPLVLKPIYNICKNGWKGEPGTTRPRPAPDIVTRAIQGAKKS